MSRKTFGAVLTAALVALAPAAAEAKKGKRADGATKTCRAERSAAGASAFRDAFGTFGTCVREQKEAAAVCREELASAPTAEAASAKKGKKQGKKRKKGKKRKARRRAARTAPAVSPEFARCVAETARELAEERLAGNEAEDADELDEDGDEGEVEDLEPADEVDEEDRPGNGFGRDDLDAEDE